MIQRTETCHIGTSRTFISVTSLCKAEAYISDLKETGPWSLARNQVCIALLSLAILAIPSASFSQAAWRVVQPAPNEPSGFLGIPDDTRAGPIFECSVSVCASPPARCTFRVYPHKPEIWSGRSTREIAADPKLAASMVTFWVGEDMDRLTGAEHAIRTVLPPPMHFETNLVRVGGADLILSKTVWYRSNVAQVLSIGAWISDDHEFQIVCHSPGLDQARVDNALKRFVAFARVLPPN